MFSFLPLDQLRLILNELAFPLDTANVCHYVFLAHDDLTVSFKVDCKTIYLQTLGYSSLATMTAVVSATRETMAWLELQRDTDKITRIK